MAECRYLIFSSDKRSLLIKKKKRKKHSYIYIYMVIACINTRTVHVILTKNVTSCDRFHSLFYFLPNDGFYTSHPRKASCLKHQDSPRSPLSSVNSLICRGSPYSCVDYHTIYCDGITHICNLYNSIEEGCIKKLGNVTK